MPKKSTKSKSKRMSLRQKYKVIRKVKEHHRKKRKELKKSGAKPKAPKDPGLPSQWPFKEDLVKEFAFKRAQILADEKRKKEEKKARRLVRARAAVERSVLQAPCCRPAERRAGCHSALTDGCRTRAQAAAAGEQTDAMALFNADANAKQEDFETRKRARIVEDFQSDLGAPHRGGAHRAASVAADCRGHSAPAFSPMPFPAPHADHSRKAYYKEFRRVVELSDVIIQVRAQRRRASKRAGAGREQGGRAGLCR